MKVYINDTELEVFNGARLQDAILSYSKKDYQLLMDDLLDVVDDMGNGMDADGSLWKGIRLYIKRKE